MNKNHKVKIDYTNYRGERSTRIITPISIEFGANKWHTTPQWLLTAYDHEKGAERNFAMCDIHGWEAL